MSITLFNNSTNSGILQGSTSAVVYTDDFITIAYNSPSKQPSFIIPTTTPLGSWGGQLCFCNKHVAGNNSPNVANSVWRPTSGYLRDLVPGTEYFFSRNGLAQGSYFLTVEGANQEIDFCRRFRLEGWPSYSMKFFVGNRFNVSYIITRIN